MKEYKNAIINYAWLLHGDTVHIVCDNIIIHIYSVWLYYYNNHILVLIILIILPHKNTIEYSLPNCKWSNIKLLNVAFSTFKLNIQKPIECKLHV